MKFNIETRPSKAEIDSFVVTNEQWENALSFFHEPGNKEALIEAARASRNNAVSHRPEPFKVGCVVQTLEPNLPEGEFGLYMAYNFKPQPVETTGEDKRCAERNALDAARSRAKVITSIVTVSKETTTGDANKSKKVLHTCRDCRDMIRIMQKEKLLRPDTIICNANDSDPENIYSEERTVEKLLELYADDEKS